MTDLGIISFEHVHAPHYLECLARMDAVHIKAVAEADSERLRAHTPQLAGVAIYEDYREMLQKEALDGVIVCAANARHKEIVIDCARSKKAILCEKPIATRTADAREMLAICQAQESLLGICFPVRFSEALQRAKRLIHEKSLGKIVAAKTTNHGTMPGGWFGDRQLAGGGAIMDHTVHVVDVLRWLFEAEFTRVFAHAATRIYDLPVEDCGLLSLEMSNEVFVTLDTSWSRPNRSFPIWGDVSLSIIGTEGILELDLFPWTINHYSEEAGKHTAISNDGDLNRVMLENFVGAIRKETTLSADGLDGLRALEVVEAAYESISTRSVVAL
ncbi:MAG TPA: Gfo/Idh/MocA family oxidoreductase [Terriglobia bacterium]|nr:Gfo/Idh/MocA family oxidoreductase [Terriglobia bacterium]